MRKIVVENLKVSVLIDESGPVGDQIIAILGLINEAIGGLPGAPEVWADEELSCMVLNHHRDKVSNP